MKQNPEYEAYLNAISGNTSTTTTSASAPPMDTPLAVVSSLSDINEATTLQADATGVPMQIAPSTIAAMENMQDTTYLNEFKSSQDVDGGELLEGLTEYFIQYEVPVGLLNKLFALKAYRLNFIVDDSGSMRAPTDVTAADATPYLYDIPPPSNTRMTRWQEAENRIHIMIDILSYIPTKMIQIIFLNAPNVIILEHSGKSIDEFRASSHQVVHTTFNSIDVKYKTPTFTVLSRVLNEASHFPDPTMHYLLTDGVPSDRPVEVVGELITNRLNPERNPITFLSCSNEDSEVEWMKEVEEIAPYCAELDDYVAEKQEVLTDQGTAFPYTKGLWMVSQLVAAINPMDLDALDESLPFSKFTLDNLLGRAHTIDEYRYYFDKNPHSPIYRDLFLRLSAEPYHSRQLVTPQEQKQRELAGGYVDGKPPSRTSGNYGYSVVPPQPRPTYSSAPSFSQLPPQAPPPPYAGPPPAYTAPPRNIAPQSSSMGFNAAPPQPPPRNIAPQQSAMGLGAPGTRTGQVAVPANAPPGSVLRLQTSDGNHLQITVPPGAVAGTLLTYKY